MINRNLVDLKELLDRASPEDRANLRQIIDAGGGDSSQILCDHIHYLRSGFLGQFFDGRDYKQLVADVADQTKIDWSGILNGRRWEDLTASEIEDAIVVKILQEILGKLSPEDRRKLAEELGREANDPNLIPQLMAGGVLVLARLSGFQIYLLATTVVGALSGALGLTLPFVIYTSVTRVLGAVLGPIGWAFLGISVLYQLNRPTWSRLIPAIVYVSYIRHKLDQAV